MISETTGTTSSEMGGTMISEIASGSVSAKASMYYIDLPMHLMMKNEVGQIAVEILAGPYIGFALTGSISGESTIFGETNTFDNGIEWGSGDNELKRFDYGLSGGVGLGYSEWSFRVTYSLGLANIANEESTDLKHRVMAFTVGFSPW